VSSYSWQFIGFDGTFYLPSSRDLSRCVRVFFLLQVSQKTQPERRGQSLVELFPFSMLSGVDFLFGLVV
jgi:hypothetical protein